MTTAVIIGRFQPLHNGHIQTLFEHAFKNFTNVLVLVGSSGEARTPKNPFTFEERREMIFSAFPPDTYKIKVVPLFDYTYDDRQWKEQVIQLIRVHADADNTIIGANKDESSYYLNLFNTIKVDPCEIKTMVHATNIRTALYELDQNEFLSKMNYYSTPYILYLCLKYVTQQVKDEYFYYKEYKDNYKNLPYPPIFTTADVFHITYNGLGDSKIILVKRKQLPGKDLLALPGGFVECNETIIDAVMREFKEETGIELLKSYLKGPEIFDLPSRSLRGRVITNVFTYTYGSTLICDTNTSETEVVEILAKDLPLYREYMFEDHWHIINQMLKKMKEQK